MKKSKFCLVTKLSSIVQLVAAVTTLSVTTSLADTYTVKSWEFNNNNRESWTYAGGLIDRGMDVNYGGIWYHELPTNSYNPQLISPTFAAINAASVGSIAMHMSDGGNKGSLQIFWRKQGQSGFSTAQSVRAVVDHTNGWCKYVFPLTQNPTWSGSIVQIRIDPADSGAGKWGWIDYIRMEALANTVSCKYYGYYHTNTEFFPSGAAPGNYAAEVAPWCNVAFVSPSKITATTGLGMSMIVHCSDIFFELQASPRRMKLKSAANYTAAFQAAYNSYLKGKAGQITALYMADEPYGNGSTKAEVEQAVAFIRNNYPEFNACKTMMIETGSRVVMGYAPPSNIDWIGFDEYGNMEIQPYRNMIINKYTNKDYFMVPEGFIWSEAPAAYKNDQNIANAQNFYKELAHANPRCKGILNFTIDNFVENGATNIGSRNLPITYATQRAIGRYITGKP
jgi:hypothetical protein